MPSYKVAVDIGGTFTDFVIFEQESGYLSTFKIPSTPANPAIAVMQGFEKLGMNLKQLALFLHGSTVGTNALVTRNLPKTGLITTKGFRDVHEIRRGNRQDLWDAYWESPPPYVRRRHRFEVDERIDYTGRILKAVDKEEARKLISIMKKRSIQSIAICFINSYVNGANEKLVKEVLSEEYPEAYVCCSHEILSEMFEHERTSTTVINACLGPVVKEYLHYLESALSQRGYRGDTLVMHSGGGLMTASAMTNLAARIANSGPTAGAIAAGYFAKMCGVNNAIGIDVGGTSTDVSLMYDGVMNMVNEWTVEFGYPVMFPTVDMFSIGAGGGSVAWLDEGGSLRNGPKSMGADPGPACYMKGGEEPTNTDANLVLRRLDHKMFLGGEVKISPEKAEKVIKQKIAEKLAVDVVEAADAIIKVANANMSDAVKLISIRRGYDPREFALVAFGGAGPLHAAFIAQELGIPTVIVPPYPGLTSATGCLLADIRHDLSVTYVVKISETRPEVLEKKFHAMEAEAIKRIRFEGVPKDKIQLLRYLDMKYIGQWRSLTINCPRPIGDNFDNIREIFHTEHQRTYAYSAREQEIQVWGLRTAALGVVEKPTFPKISRRGSKDDAFKGTRQVYFHEAGDFVETMIYDRFKLPVSSRVQGPAIIEQKDSTTAVPPKTRVDVEEHGELIITV